MLQYILKRVAYAVPVVLVVAIIVFSLLYLAPGDPATIIAGENASIADIQRIRVSLGLDQPYLVQLGTWLFKVVQLDLGKSIFSGMTVTELIMQRVGPTASLMALTSVLSIGLAIPLGVVSAWKKGKAIDQFGIVLATLGFAVPVFVIGYVLAYIFGLQLGWLPVQGYRSLDEGVAPWLASIILPAVSLSLVYIALIARVTRSSMIESLNEDFVRTAIAKGAPMSTVLTRHALRTSLVPIVTVIGTGVALMIGGSVVTESVFALPGIGRLVTDAILQRDYPVIQGVTLMFSLLYVLINLLIDVSYLIIDPRIKF
jgi:peptide/nickel transport system permease protein